MTTPESPPPTEPTKPDGSPNPRPGVLLFASLLAVGMIFVIYLDSQSQEFDGKIPVAIIAALIAGVLGFDISKFLRGGGS